jgi:hypothetical protein
MDKFYRIKKGTNGSYVKEEVIGEDVFRLAVGSALSDQTIDVSELFARGVAATHILRVASTAQPAGVSVWRMSESKGRAERWSVGKG